MEKATHNLSLGEGTRSSAKKPATTRTDSSYSPLLESKLERTGRWTRSGKKNPCPICGRTKDDKCAFKSDTIH